MRRAGDVQVLGSRVTKATQDEQLREQGIPIGLMPPGSLIVAEGRSVTIPMPEDMKLAAELGAAVTAARRAGSLELAQQLEADFQRVQFDVRRRMEREARAIPMPPPPTDEPLWRRGLDEALSARGQDAFVAEMTGAFRFEAGPPPPARPTPTPAPRRVAPAPVVTKRRYNFDA